MTLKFISYSDDWDVAIIYNAEQGPVAKMNFLTEKKFHCGMPRQFGGVPEAI